MPAPIAWNRSPLPPNTFAPLPLTAILPEGWLRRAVKDSPVQSLDDRLTRAFLLEDEADMGAAKQAVERLLAEEAAPKGASLRALTRLHGVTADKAIPTCLLRHARALRDRLARETLPPTQAADGSDLLLTALWLYNLTGQKALLALCKMLKAGAPDWMSTFHIFPQTKPVKAPPEKGTDAECRVLGRAIAASLKTPALQALFEGGLKNETAFMAGWEKLIRYHGAAHGLFNADPYLAGANPSRFVEAETVYELLFTLQTLCSTLSDPAIGDILEQVAYTALPAAHGRQAANQLTPSEGAASPGIAQFAASLWMATQDEGLAAVSYAPCAVRWRIGGQAVRVEVDSGYPHSETVTLRIRAKEPAQFPLYLRIPGWAAGATAAYNEEEPTALANGYQALRRTWRDKDTLTLHLPMPVALTKRYHQSLSLSRGPVGYALPVSNGQPWQFALPRNPAFQTGLSGSVPFIETEAYSLAGWGARDGIPAPPPVSPSTTESARQTIRLIPYGLTKARIAQFPQRRETEAFAP